MQPTYAIVICGVPPPRCPTEGAGGRIDVIPCLCRSARPVIGECASPGERFPGRRGGSSKRGRPCCKCPSARGAARCPPCWSTALGVPGADRGRHRRGAAAHSGRRCRPRSASIARPSSKFFLDGNFDHVADFKLVFGAPGPDVGLLGDLAGVGNALSGPVPQRRLVRRQQQGRGRRPDVLLRRRRDDIPLIADMDGDGTRGPGPLPRRRLVRERDAQRQRHAHVRLRRRPATSRCSATSTAPARRACSSTGAAASGTARPPRNGVVDKIYLLRRRCRRHPDAVRLRRRRQGRPRHLPQRHRGTSRPTATATPTRCSSSATAGDKPLYAGIGATSTQFLDAARFLTHASFGPVPTELTQGRQRWASPPTSTPSSRSRRRRFPAMAYQPQNQPANCTSPLTAGGPAGRRQLRHQLSARPLHAVRGAALLLQERADRAGPASPARRLGAVADPRDFGGERSDRVREPRTTSSCCRIYAFDNFWNLLFRISVDPLMGNYLDMVNNAKADPVKGTNPNENYAREIMQLFSIGLWELNNDGTLLLDARAATRSRPTRRPTSPRWRR